MSSATNIIIKSDAILFDVVISGGCSAKRYNCSFNDASVAVQAMLAIVDTTALVFSQVIAFRSIVVESDKTCTGSSLGLYSVVWRCEEPVVTCEQFLKILAYDRRMSAEDWSEYMKSCVPISAVCLDG